MFVVSLLPGTPPRAENAREGMLGRIEGSQGKRKMEIKTDNLQIAKLVLAADVAKNYLYTYETQRKGQEKAFVEFLSRFADAYRVINDLASSHYHPDQVKDIISQVETAVMNSAKDG